MSDSSTQISEDTQGPRLRRTATRPKVSAGFVFAVSAAVFCSTILTARLLLLGGLGLPIGILADIAFSLFLATVVTSTKRPFLWALVVDLVLAITFVAAGAFFAYFDQLPRLALMQLGGQLGGVDASIAELLSPRLVLLFLGAPVLAAMYWRFSGLTRRPSREVVLGGAAGALCLFAVMAFVSASVARAGTVDSVEAARRYGLVGWTVGSAFNDTDAEELVSSDEALGDEIQVASVATTTVSATGSVEPTRAMTPQENIDALIGVVASRTVGAPAPGAEAGMNVIVIQWEALQSAIIGRQMAGKPITPTLDKLIAESYYFPSMISQAGQGMTADVEFVTATGLLPPKGKPAAVMASDRKLSGIVRTLGNSGWQTVTMHANYARFWNRTKLYPAIGWQRYYDREYFGADDVLGMGESDRGFFTKALPIIRKYDDAKKPAYIELITLSSHHPFNQLPARLRPLPLTPAAKGTLAGRYAQSQNYTDREVGAFLAKLDKEGILDRSVLIIYGDHFGLSDGNAKELRGRTEVVGDYRLIDRLKVPLIIHLPKQTAGVRSDMLISQADLPATVADLVGVPLTGSRVFGASAFLQRHDPIVPTASRLPLGSFVFDGGVFRPGMGLDGAVLYNHDGTQRSAETSDRARYARTLELNRLSDGAVGRLKKLTGVDAVDDRALLPPAGERAAEGR